MLFFQNFAAIKLQLTIKIDIKNQRELFTSSLIFCVFQHYDQHKRISRYGNMLSILKFDKYHSLKSDMQALLRTEPGLEYPVMQIQLALRLLHG